MALVLLFSQTYDQLLSYVVFCDWLFFGLTAAGIFMLRRAAAASGDAHALLSRSGPPLDDLDLRRHLRGRRQQLRRCAAPGPGWLRGARRRRHGLSALRPTRPAALRPVPELGHSSSKRSESWNRRGSKNAGACRNRRC